jgi:hypothetical protein
MSLRAYVLAFGLAALLNATQATFGRSTPWCTWCTDDSGASDSGYYGNGQCRVTMPGLGVCVPSPPISPRRPAVFIGRY